MYLTIAQAVNSDWM